MKEEFINTPGNPLHPHKAIPLPADFYSEEDKKYFSFLQKRLEDAKNQKFIPWPELNNLTWPQYVDQNEKFANTYVEQKVEKDDIVVSAGTLESKLDTLLSNLNNLNLEAEVLSFDKSNLPDTLAGNAMTELLCLTGEMDGADGAGDEDKKMMRQRELLKQGTVFVQDEWLKKFEYKGKKDKTYTGQYINYDKNKLKKNLELVFDGPSRTILSPDNVYLGNMRVFYNEDQPYIFLAVYEDYSVARARFGQFENFKYVVPGEFKQDLKAQASSASIYNNTWRLNALKENQVEIIMYQDQPNDEFQILLNGVPMLPVGFALSNVAPGGKYNIIKQVLKPIRKEFALGKAFVQFGSVVYLSQLIDEMLKLFTLKTRKSVSPPYTNNSGRYVSPNALRPGRISMNIPTGALNPIGQEGQGVTAGEFGLLNNLSEKIDNSTVSPVFSGQLGKSGTTATEVLEVQKQAKMTLGQIVAAAMLLEKKLAYLRIYIILENWFEPVAQTEVLDETRKSLIKKAQYRVNSKESFINGAGKGVRTIKVLPKPHPTGRELRTEEDKYEEMYGTPVRITVIDPESMKEARRKWFVVITPKEKESSAYYKLLFREYMNDIIAMTQFGIAPDRDDLKKEFARVWQKSPGKVFTQDQQTQPGSDVNPDGTPKLSANEKIKSMSNAGDIATP